MEEQLSQVAPPGAAVIPAGKRGFRLLVIDDNHQIVRLSSLLLEAEGHTVATAEEGSRGLSLAREFQPQVVLCDVGLPGEMSGFDVARAFRADAQIRGAYLIALTAHDDEAHRAEAVRAGFDLFLVKPVDFPDLSRTIEQSLVERSRC